MFFSKLGENNWFRYDSRRTYAILEFYNEYISIPWILTFKKRTRNLSERKEL